MCQLIFFYITVYEIFCCVYLNGTFCILFHLSAINKTHFTFIYSARVRVCVRACRHTQAVRYLSLKQSKQGFKRLCVHRTNAAFLQLHGFFQKIQRQGFFLFQSITVNVIKMPILQHTFHIYLLYIAFIFCYSIYKHNQ